MTIRYLVQIREKPHELPIYMPVHEVDNEGNYEVVHLLKQLEYHNSKIIILET